MWRYYNERHYIDIIQILTSVLVVLQAVKRLLSPRKRFESSNNLKKCMKFT